MYSWSNMGFPSSMDYPAFQSKLFKRAFVVVQSLNRVWLFATPWTGLPVLHYLSEFAQIHVH